jgi:hypothetical protein
MTERSGRGEKDTRKAWNDVGERFSELGRRFNEHYRKLGKDAGAAAEQQRQAMNEALRKTVDQLDQTFTAVGDALRDPETKTTLNRAVRSLGDALGTTFQTVGDEIGRRVRGRGRGSTAAER